MQFNNKRNERRRNRKKWDKEEAFIDNFEDEKDKDHLRFQKLLGETRSIHFLLKPVEDGLNDLRELPPAMKVNENTF